MTRPPMVTDAEIEAQKWGYALQPAHQIRRLLADRERTLRLAANKNIKCGHCDFSRRLHRDDTPKHECPEKECAAMLKEAGRGS